MTNRQSPLALLLRVGRWRHFWLGFRLRVRVLFWRRWGFWRRMGNRRFRHLSAHCRLPHLQPPSLRPRSLLFVSALSHTNFGSATLTEQKADTISKGWYSRWNWAGGHDPSGSASAACATRPAIIRLRLIASARWNSATKRATNQESARRGRKTRRTWRTSQAVRKNSGRNGRGHSTIVNTSR